MAARTEQADGRGDAVKAMSPADEATQDLAIALDGIGEAINLLEIQLRPVTGPERDCEAEPGETLVELERSPLVCSIVGSADRARSLRARLDRLRSLIEV